MLDRLNEETLTVRISRVALKQNRNNDVAETCAVFRTQKAQNSDIARTILQWYKYDQ